MIITKKRDFYYFIEVERGEPLDEAAWAWRDIYDSRLASDIRLMINGDLTFRSIKDPADEYFYINVLEDHIVDYEMGDQFDNNPDRFFDFIRRVTIAEHHGDPSIIVSADDLLKHYECIQTINMSINVLGEVYLYDLQPSDILLLDMTR